MAMLLIDRVQTITSGREEANIVGIAPLSSDCFIGTIVSRSGMREAQWNDVGICRGGTSADNLDPQDPVVADVIEVLKLLRRK